MQMNHEEKQEDIPEWLRILLILGGTILLGYLVARVFQYLFNSNTKDDETAPRIFISHSWSYDEDYSNLVNKFSDNEFKYYNHSIPSDRPLNTTIEKEIDDGIRKKMSGCSKVVVLAGEYANRKWIKREVEIAKELGKVVVAIRPWGQKTIPSYLKKKADTIIGFNSKAIIENIKG